MMIRWLFLSSIFALGLFGFDLKSLFTYTFDASKNYDTQKGKELYFHNKCHTCHGELGEKSSANFEALKDMSPADIKAALIGYDLEGGATNRVTHSRKLSHSDMDTLIAYIKGEDFAVKLQAEDLLEKEPPQKTKHGIFIK